MIKFSIYYPFSEEGSFNHDYYRDSHMPMVQSMLGPRCVRFEIDEGLDGMVPGSRPAFIAVGHLYLNIDTADEFRQMYAPHGAGIKQDVSNFTGIQPKVQLSRLL